jgi:hypothetical protein
MIEQIVEALLDVPAITTAVGRNAALQQLPQGAEYPALTYQVVSSVGFQILCSPPKAFRSRVQINPLAGTMGAVNALHALARAALESDTERTAAGLRCISCRFEGYGPPSKDDFTGMWTKPADYILMHEE